MDSCDLVCGDKKALGKTTTAAATWSKLVARWESAAMEKKSLFEHF